VCIKLNNIAINKFSFTTNFIIYHMKILFSFLLSCAFCAAFAQTKPVVVSFYNLENLFDTINDPKINDEDFLPNGSYAYTTEVYTKKLSNLSDVLSLLGTDKNPDGFAFCGVAEIENEGVLKDLVKQPKLINRKLKIVHYNSPDNRGIDVALLYNPKYFKVLSSEALPTRLPADGGFKENTRDVLWVTGKLNGELVHVFVNHWPSRRGGEAASAPKRMIAAGISRKIIDSLQQLDPLVKVINMGDLNDDPINKSMTEVLKCKANIKDMRAGELYNPWVNFYKQGLGTMAFNDSWGLFDQIVMTEGFTSIKATGLKYDDARVFNQPWMIEKFGQYKGYPKRAFSGSLWNDGYSDHFATIVYLKGN
jgi:Endonuclease/Exonuclease/phosphatase family